MAYIPSDQTSALGKRGGADLPPLDNCKKRKIVENLRAVEELFVKMLETMTSNPHLGESAATTAAPSPVCFEEGKSDVIDVTDRGKIKDAFPGLEYLEDKKYAQNEQSLALMRVQKVELVIGGQPAYGVFAKNRIGKGITIGRYLGERLTGYQNDDDDYVFNVGDEEVITGLNKGNWTRFMNHSYFGYNVENVVRNGTVFFRTTCAIEEGEQLVYDYGDTYFKEREYVPAVLQPEDGLETVREKYNSQKDNYSLIDDRFVTPVIEAVLKGNLGQLKELRKMRANFTLPSLPSNLENNPYKLKTPLHHAVEGGKIEIVRWLLTNLLASQHQVTGNNESALHLAAGYSDRKVALRMVQLLLSFGLDFNGQRFDGKTILYIAIDQGDVAMVKYLVNREIKEGMEDGGREAEISIEGEKINSVLYAIRIKRVNVLEVLLTGNSWTQSKSSKGRNVLHYAFLYGGDQTEEIIKMLLNDMSTDDLEFNLEADQEGVLPQKLATKNKSKLLTLIKKYSKDLEV